MPKVIKFDASALPNTRTKGNMRIGANSHDYGNSYYSMIEPPDGGYTVYENKASGGPSIRVANNEAELINITREISGTTYNSALECLNYFRGQSDKMVVSSKDSFKNTVTDGLILELNTKNNTSFIDNEPTENVANTDSSRTMITHAGSSTFSDAPEKGPGWKKITITARSSNFRVTRFPYISQPQNTTRTYSVELDFGTTSGYYVRGDGFTGFGSSSSTNGIYSTTFTTTTNSGVLALFLNNNTTSVSGINDVIYYRHYQVEDKPQRTSFTTGSRSQNTTWYDLSGNGNNGTLTNGPTYGPEGSIVLDGTNDYVLTTWKAPSGDKSMNFWVKYNSLDAAGGNGYSLTGAQQVNAYFYTGIQDGGQGYSYAGNTGGNYNYYFNANQWYNVATVMDNGVTRHYVNGEQVATRNYTTSNASTVNFPIGCVHNGSTYQHFFDASFANIKVYSRVLNPSEILQNYYGGNIITDNLVLALDAGNLISYESGSATTYSLTGSVYSGSLTNGVSFSNNNGGIWDFDGSDDIISIPTYTFGNGNWTLSVWANTDSTNNYNIMSNSSGGPVTNSFGFHGGKIFYRNYNGTWQDNSGNTTLSTGEWYLLTWVNYGGATAQDGTMKMFVNGISDSDVFNSYTTNGGPCNAIGRNWFSHYNGRISNVYIQTKSLSDSEVLQNFNAQRNRFGI